MRKVDLEKDNRLKRAVIDLSFEQGLASLTTAGIAKVAKISPATIYLRYEDKTDLLSRVYEETRHFLQAGLAALLDPQQPIDEQIRVTQRYIVKQIQNYPREFQFIQSAWMNKKLLDQRAVVGTLNEADALNALFDRIAASSEYSYPNRQVLEVMFSMPAQVFENQTNSTDEQIDAVSNMLIKSIKA